MLEFSIQKCPEIGQDLSFRQQIHKQGQLEIGKIESNFYSKTRWHCPHVHYNVHVLILLPKPDPSIDAIIIVKHERTVSKMVTRRSPCSMSSRPCLRKSRRGRRLPRQHKRYGLWQSDFKKSNRGVKFEMILTFKDKSSRSVGESSLSVGASIVGASSPYSPANCGNNWWN
jgi:hypothetical protein